MKKYFFDKINEFPKSSGIYYFYDGNDQILYVGKASTIQGRMRNHCHNFWIVSKFSEGKNLCMDFLSKNKHGIFDEELFSKIIHFELDLNYRLNFNFTPVNIDYVLDLVDYVLILESEKEELVCLEEKVIQQLEPPYNHQSMDSRYSEALERYWNLSESFGNYFELVKNSKRL